LLREFTVIRQQQQAFALSVEPADVGERRKFRREQIVNRIGYVWIASRTDESSRFIEQNVNGRGLMNEFAIDFDVIGCRWLEMKIATRFSIHGDATAGDQFVRAAPRSHAGGSEKAIEAHGTLKR